MILLGTIYIYANREALEALAANSAPAGEKKSTAKRRGIKANDDEPVTTKPPKKQLDKNVTTKDNGRHNGTTSKHGNSDLTETATMKPPAQAPEAQLASEDEGSDTKDGRKKIAKWTPDEDAKILELIQKFGTRSWSVIGNHFGNRNGKQCRERWHNQVLCISTLSSNGV